jgi:hypothetical protein
MDEMSEPWVTFLVSDRNTAKVERALSRTQARERARARLGVRGRIADFEAVDAVAVYDGETEAAALARVKAGGP